MWPFNRKVRKTIQPIKENDDATIAMVREMAQELIRLTEKNVLEWEFISEANT